MRNLALAGSVISILAVSALSSAQTTGGLPSVTPTNISIRAGGSFALNGPLRDAQKLWFGLGVEYQFTAEGLGGGIPYLSVDWMGKSGAGGHGNYFPICINERFPFAKSMDGKYAYAFVGAGVVIFDVNSTATTGALRAGLGYQLTSAVFAETSFVVSGQANGYQATGIGFYLGYRF